MTEVFLIVYETTKDWTCFDSTHSLRQATQIANNLRDLGYRVKVQSVLINSHGRVVGND